MKAILVIDMPSDCNHCQFADFSNGQWECNQHKGGRIGESMKICSTPSWCPLKPMPDIKTKEAIKLANMINPKATFQEFADGWNACLDSIIGENNESNIKGQ